MSFYIESALVDNKRIELVPQSTHDIGNKYTVLIGRNGTGKSIFLSKLANSLCSIQMENKYLKRDFDINEKNNTKMSFNIVNDGVENEIRLEGRKFVGGDSKYLLPSVLTCISTSPFDKFSSERRFYNSKNEVNTFYHYFGLKELGRENAIHAFIEKILYSKINSLLQSDRESFEKILGFLNYQPKIKLEFRTRISFKTLFKLDDEELVSQIERPIFTHTGVYRRSKSQSDYDVSRIRNALLFINDYILSSSDRRSSAEARYFDVEINALDENMINIPEIVMHEILYLMKLNLLSIRDIYLYKKSGDEVVLYEASSGEQCLLINTFGIANCIADNALILIDEPEVSLHPEWQEVYIELLMDVFSHKKGCHFIIATHSPQIISNLKKDNCFITTLENGKTYHAKDFINKSADFQLATLMEAPGHENEYLKRLAVNILSKISANEKLSEQDINDVLWLKDISKNIEPNDTVMFLIGLIVKSKVSLK
ncbi:ATP-binding protein [Salmonella enterica]|nr:ATP-binding protein [Salmonella enterica]